MILYDYKKDYELRIKPCKNRNLGTIVNISTTIFLYGSVFILGIILFLGIMGIFKQYLQPLCELIDQQFDLIMKMLDLIYNVYKLKTE